MQATVFFNLELKIPHSNSQSPKKTFSGPKNLLCIGVSVSHIAWNVGEIADAQNVLIVCYYCGPGRILK
jgi:hypothetical protein